MMDAEGLLAFCSRPARTVHEEPRLTMLAWRFFAFEDERGAAAIMLVGRVLETNTSRVTSPVVAIDLAARMVTTRSGRVYDLPGPPGHDERAETAIRLDAAARGATLVDVTDLVFGVERCQ